MLPTLPLKENYTVLGDTAASYHYIEQAAVPHFTDIKPTSGPIVPEANGERIQPLAQAQLPLTPDLSAKAQHTYISDDLQT